MSRTKKDLLVVGRTQEEVKVAVQKWFSDNKISTIDNNSNIIKGRWGTGFLTAPKYFQAILIPTEEGIIAKTEGWITVYWLTEVEFSSSGFLCGIPKREGWRAMQSLWDMLSNLTKKT